MRRAIDISRTLGRDTLDWPGDRPFSLSIGESAGAVVSEIAASAHAGTHLDAPAHYIAGGATIDRFPAGLLLSDCLVVGVDGPLTRAALSAAPLARFDSVLFRTANRRLPRDRFPIGYTVPDEECAAWLATLPVRLYGLDWLSFDRYDAANAPVHRALLGAGTWLLEDVDLTEVEPGRYSLVVAPLKIAGAEAAPVRAFLLTDD